jgi:hypothetical protein
MSNLTPTPKVAAAAVAGIIAAALLANLDLITPDLFDGLGKWSHLVYGLTIALVMSAAGWLKSEGNAPTGTPPTPQPGPVPLPAIVGSVEVAPVTAEPAPVTPVYEAPVVVEPVA